MPETPISIESPLEANSPETITELFSRDPLSWTDADVDAIIAHQRSQRLKIGEGPAKKEKAAKLPAADFTDKSGEDILASLGLADEFKS